MSERLKEYLQQLASKEIPEDDESELFSPYDCYGGNMDDAYYGGRLAGRVDLARELLENFGD